MLDKILGVLLAGTWVNMAFWTLEIVQVIRYFIRFKNDSVWVRGSVAGILLVDTLSTMAVCANTYLYCVTGWGDEVFLSAQYWPLSVLTVSNGISGFILHLFLLQRIWKLSRSSVLVVTLGIVAFAGLGGAIFTAVALAVFKQVADRAKLKTSASIWLSTASGADVLLALTLVILLDRARRTVSSFGQSAMSKQLSNLARVAVETGCITSLYALGVLVSYLVAPQTNIDVGIVSVLGRLYAHVMLYNLHGRKSRAHSGSSDRLPKNFTSYEDRSRGGGRSTQPPRERHLERAIAVSSTVSYQVEDEQGVIERSSDMGALSLSDEPKRQSLGGAEDEHDAFELV